MACDLNLSADQRQMLDSAQAMLDAHFPMARRRLRRPDDLSELAGFGLFDLAVSGEESGLSVVDEALLHVRLGRHAVSPSALAAAIGARMARAADRSDIARRIAAAELGICAAVTAQGSLLLLERGDAGLALSFEDGGLVLLDLSAAETQKVEALGHGIPLERMKPGLATEIARSSDPALTDTADLLVAAQLLGTAEAARDLAVAYAGMRQQFGQPIGGFQAIKHHCANMALAAEMASAQLDIAAIGLRDGAADARFQVSASRLLAEQAAYANARNSVQVHGGIGFSAEADIHHHLKQAHLLSRIGRPADLLALAAPLTPHSGMTSES